ncbi:hypothetical protein MTO96_017381 [Rhipicephalus appendiculatus]
MRLRPAKTGRLICRRTFRKLVPVFHAVLCRASHSRRRGIERGAGNQNNAIEANTHKPGKASGLFSLGRPRLRDDPGRRQTPSSAASRVPGVTESAFLSAELQPRECERKNHRTSERQAIGGCPQTMRRVAFVGGAAELGRWFSPGRKTMARAAEHVPGGVSA